MNLLIENLIEKVIKDLKSQGELPADLDIKIQVERTRDESHGHFASNVALVLAKFAGIAPRDLAELIKKHIPTNDQIKKIEIAGPGFLNFFLTENTLYSIVRTILEQGDTFGQSGKGKGKRIHMEFVSANPTGPLHVGHGRSAAYGACVGNLLEATGYKVHRDYYVNDAGRQMRILAFSTWFRYLELLNEPITLPTKAYQGQYIIDIAKTLLDKYHDNFKYSFSEIKKTLPTNAWEIVNKKHPSKSELDNLSEQYLDRLIETMHKLLGETEFEIFRQATLENILADIKQDLEEFGVVYDDWFRESKLFQEGLLDQGIELLKSQGHVFENDGALWFRATDFGDEKDRVLLRANGQPTYFASDVAYHLYKYQQGYDHIIDIFGADHHGYIQRIRAFLKGLGKDPEKLDILLVQFAILYRDKEKVAMSTRAGEYVTLRQLRHEVGNDVARYFYIMRKPEQHLDFDLDLAKSESNENPVFYIQYVNARISSVWRQLKTDNIVWDKANGMNKLTTLAQNIEKTIMHSLSQYPEIVLQAALRHEPHTLASFLQKIANLFHSYYNSTRFIVKETDLRDARLCLIAAIQQVIKNGLTILGLSTPESM